MKQDLITLADFNSDELSRWVALAEEIKRTPENYQEALKGKTLGMIFHKKSTRTRISFEVGILQLGGHAIFFGPNESQMSRGETIEDTGKVLSRYLDGIMIRTYSHQDVLDLATHATIPVINGLTDFNHPCQALADILTLKEVWGTLEGRKLVYVGDGNNVAVSLLMACVKFGIHISIVSPKSHSLSPDILEPIRKEAEERQIKMVFTDNVEEGVTGADAIYTDVWASMGQEEEHAQRLKIFAPYQINDPLMAMAKPDAVFMHCLPAHRGEEVSASVMDGDASIVFDQAENRLHMQKAIMYHLMK